MDPEFLHNHLHLVTKRLVLFDFDGTITTRDTFLEFIKYYHGNTKFFLGFLLSAPWIALMTFKIIPNWRTKERVLTWFFAGHKLRDFDSLAYKFCHDVVPKLIRPGALQAIQKHIAEGATVVVISASAENWVRPWCEKYGLNCLATKLQVKNGIITGKIDGFNCYGPEKEKRIRACYNLKDYDEVFAYGDSRGDLEMLALAKEQFYKPFRAA